MGSGLELTAPMASYESTQQFRLGRREDLPRMRFWQSIGWSVNELYGKQSWTISPCWTL